jgi:hypothetical protein
MSQLTIAIDFDDTWSADPEGWRCVFDLLTTRGHVVIMATGRHQWSDDMGRAALPPDMPIVYCGSELKERATRAAGYSVDIWIDDMPGMIQHCHILGGADAEL